MAPPSHLLVVLVLAGVTAGCGSLSETERFQRELQNSFKVTPGSTVEVDISSGSIRTATGPAGTVNVTLEQRVYARTEHEADQIITNHDVVVAQQDGVVTVKVRRKEHVNWRNWRTPSFNTRIEVPADVRLRLRTSGGSIEVRGDRTALADAHTSGGSVTVDGGSGPMVLGTSGGNIDVGRALSSLTAETSGGNVRLDYAGAAAKQISLQTSGGNVRAGVDPSANLDLIAETSGGSVEVKDLTLANESSARSRVAGRLNVGGGKLDAHTSGGSVEVFRAVDGRP